MSIITYPLNGIDYVAEDAETYLCTRISGVFSDDDCYSVTVTGTRQITVSPGLAWIQNTDHCGKSVYNSANYKISVPVADGTNPRIDRVVLHFDKYANETTLELLTGTPAASPKAPAITQTETIYELGLATIYVGAATVVLDQSNITDTRLDESVCGLMRDAVTGIPTQELYDQWQAWYAKFISTADAQLESEHAEFEAWMTANGNDFNEWFENLQYVLDGDVAGHLQNEIDSLGTGATDLEEKLEELRRLVYSLHNLTMDFAFYCHSDDSLNFYTDLPENIPNNGDTYDGKNVYFIYKEFCSIPMSMDGQPWRSSKERFTSIIIDESFIGAAPTDTSYWFEGCENVTSIKGLEYINMSNVSKMTDMFMNCQNITSLDGINKWDTSNVIDMGGIFGGCSMLKIIDVSQWDTLKVNYMSQVFAHCTNLATIYSDDSKFVIDNVTADSNMFEDCQNLVGGNGTKYDSDKIDSSMAHVDVSGNPGYFTKK